MHKDPEARRRYQRKYQRANPETYRLSVKRRDDKVRSLIWEAKARPCADCGVQYPPWVMDLDHLDPGDKSPKLRGDGRKGRMGSLPMAELVREIAKCEVVCANCHRQRTYLQRHRRWVVAGACDMD